jgi:DNA-binding CsgD family transcriptional regulator
MQARPPKLRNSQLGGDQATALRTKLASGGSIRNAAGSISKERFKLTPAEARLVLRLIAGESLRSAAKALNIGYETARTTLKSVFHKTGTCRQAELVIVIINAMNIMR